jgi:hypothetical protein
LAAAEKVCRENSGELQRGPSVLRGEVDMRLPLGGEGCKNWFECVDGKMLCEKLSWRSDGEEAVRLVLRNLEEKVTCSIHHTVVDCGSSS